MQTITHAMLVSTLMAGCFGKTIVIQDSTLISTCTHGARSEVDTYSINGTIQTNSTRALLENWQYIVFIRVLKNTSTDFGSICQLFLNETCTPLPLESIKCECQYSNVTEQASFTVSGTVQANYSNAVLFVQWNTTNGTFTEYSDKNLTFPEIYDVNDAQLNLTVAQRTGIMSNEQCKVSLTLNKSNDLELCCSDTAMPCYPRITLNGTWFTNTTEMCVRYPASQLASDGVTVDLVLSYSVCNSTDYRQRSECLESSATPPTGSTPPPVPAIISAVIVPTAVVIIIVLVTAVYCYKKHKRSKAASNRGTNEHAEKAHTTEHHQKDSQYPEHTNQAYNERRSSPSEVNIDTVKTTTHDNDPQHNTGQEKDSNAPISGRTNDDNTSQTVPGNLRQLPPLKGTHTQGQLHPATSESHPSSVEITSTDAEYLDN